MSKLCRVSIPRFLENLRHTFDSVYGKDRSGYGPLLIKVASLTLSLIALSNAPYHNLEHTVLATSTGQQLLVGKQRQGEAVSPKEWFHYLLALLCHDIGFIRGICRDDRPQYNVFSNGKGELITFSPTNTDASFSPYHVDRGKQFVLERFQWNSMIDVDQIQHYIELTRFPVPAASLYQDKVSYAGLTRAADLIGQLSDVFYIDKLPDLFAEFEETGFNQVTGYRNHEDILRAYPDFYRTVALPYIDESLVYLAGHVQGRQILAQLQRNLQIAENYRQIAELREALLGSNCGCCTTPPLDNPHRATPSSQRSPNTNSVPKQSPPIAP
jgi:hypothetical protein